MMGWQLKQQREGTLPERQLRSILDEMIEDNLIEGYDKNISVDTGSRDYCVEADCLVDNALVLEAQGSYWHLKKIRMHKDVSKKVAFENLGYEVLALWDDELNNATIPKYCAIWRPAVKSWINIKLQFGRIRRQKHLEYVKATTFTIKAHHPELGEITLNGDERRM
jgi:very-short-patch-repair endonuclease